MKLIVGLGNPGLRYRATRHNIGFNAVRLLAKRHRIRIARRRLGAKVGRGRIAGHEVMLALPERFMNLSGEPLKALVNIEKIAQRDLLVVCDDVNLMLGRLRFRSGGSSGGHKGLKSIIENLGEDDFARLRVGVGREGLQGDITGYVLGNFTGDEKKALPDVISRAADACEHWIRFGCQETANRFNPKPNLR
jgi:PTH1 family peptidyl-tRNA hydrolase